MASKETTADFEKQLASITSHKPPVSASKIQTLTKLALKNHKNYKLIVHNVQKFIQKTSTDYKLAGLYVVDSIVRASASKNMEFITRFQKVLPAIFPNLVTAPTKDLAKVQRVLALWKKSNIFEESLLNSIQDLYFPGTSEDDSPDAKRKRELGQSESDSPVNKGKTVGVDPTALMATLNTLSTHIQAASTTAQSLPVSNIAPPQYTETSLLQTSSLPVAPVAMQAPPLGMPNFPQNIYGMNTVNVSDPVHFNYSDDEDDHQAGQYPFPPTTPAGVPLQGQGASGTANYVQAGYEYGHYGMQGAHNVAPSNYKPAYATSAINNSGHQAALSTSAGQLAGSPMSISPTISNLRRSQDISTMNQTVNHANKGSSNHSNSFERGLLVKVMDDPSVGPGEFRVLSRTLYVGGLAVTVTKERLQDMFSRVGEVSNISTNPAKSNAFVKMAERAKAEQAFTMFMGAIIDGLQIKVGWGCGFGARDMFDYRSGSSIMTVSKLSESERRFLTTSIRGGFGSPDQLRGGVVVEEPDTIVPKNQNSKAGGSGSQGGHGFGSPNFSDQKANIEGGRLLPTNSMNQRPFPMPVGNKLPTSIPPYSTQNYPSYPNYSQSTTPPLSSPNYSTYPAPTPLPYSGYSSNNGYSSQYPKPPSQPYPSSYEGSSKSTENDDDKRPGKRRKTRWS